MDWCHHPEGFTQQQLYSNFSAALKSTGRDVFFSICEWGLVKPWTWGKIFLYVSSQLRLI